MPGALTVYLEMSKAERLLSYSVLSMITAKSLASAPTTGLSEEEEDEEEDGEEGESGEEGEEEDESGEEAVSGDERETETDSTDEDADERAHILHHAR